MGVLGTFTLRVVLPWYHEGELLGYLEMGEEIDHIIERLRHVASHDIYVFIDKAQLDEKKLKETMGIVGRYLDWSRYPDHLLVSTPTRESTLPAALERTLQSPSSILLDATINITVPEHHYKAVFLPLRDVQGTQVGLLLMVISTSRWYASNTRQLVVIIITLLVMGGGAFFLFWRLARKTEETLDKNRERLLHEYEKRETLQQENIEKLEQQNQLVKKTEQHLNQIQHGLTEAQRIAHLGNWEWDIATDKLIWSDEVYRIFGMLPGDKPLTYETLLATIPDDQRSRVEQKVQRAMKEGNTYQIEYTVRRPNLSERRIIERGEVVIENGKTTHILGTVQDITEQYHIKQQVEQLGRIFDNASNEIYLIDANTFHIIHANHTACSRLDFSNDELSSMSYLEIASDLQKQQFIELLQTIETEGYQEVSCEGLHLRKNGDTYPVEIRLQQSKNGQHNTYIAIVLDISERIEQQRAMQHQALHDTLTGLPNRTHFLGELEREIARAQRSNESLLLLQVDINNLAEINDTLGHDSGDLILQQFAKRLQQSSRISDIVARIGGDEFCLLLSGVEFEDKNEITGKLLQSLRRAFDTNTISLMIEATIGIACYPDHADSARELMQRSDIALKRAQQYGSRVESYNPELDPFSVRKLILSSHLRHSIEHNELMLYFQPKVAATTLDVPEVEALLRWEHPEHGMVSPAEFIPIAEKTGQIRALTLWVIEQACMQIAQWQSEGLTIRIAVNLSAHNLRESDLLDYIIEQVNATAIQHELLCFEMTESAMMSDPDYTIGILNELAALGHRIAIDDYGTGYSSLSYLQRLPADELKIDSSFIFTMLENDDNESIVRSTITLAHNLGLSVTAEGVESAELADALRKLGCDLLQGYHFSKPTDAESFKHWLNANAQSPLEI